MREKLVEMIKMLRDVMKIPYTVMCGILKMAYSSFMRWKSRADKGEPTVKASGPKKEIPLEVKELQRDLQGLRHGRKRTRQTGVLWEKYQESVSRRDLQALVEQARRESLGRRRESLWRVEWKVPGSVWGMDDTEVGRDILGRRLFVHTVKDLGSRYRFSPICGDFPKGEDVAKNLVKHFDRYGAPLVLKADLGSNLNHTEVWKTLSKYMVIPLMSPPRYPQYNGSVEKSQGELKAALRERIPLGSPLPWKHLGAYAESVFHDLNHRPSRILEGRTSCEVFFSQKGGAKFFKRKRRSIFEWIKGLFYVILNALGEDTKRAAHAAWRIAVETWLRMNGLIEITVAGNVLPYFSREMSH